MLQIDDFPLQLMVGYACLGVNKLTRVNLFVQVLDNLLVLFTFNHFLIQEQLGSVDFHN